MQLIAPERARRVIPNDNIDSRILHVLQRDGRISNLKLAEQVNRSPSAVLERVKRLKREGYILGYQARLSREKLGIEVLAFVEVQLERMDAELMARCDGPAVFGGSIAPPTRRATGANNASASMRDSPRATCRAATAPPHECASSASDACACRARRCATARASWRSASTSLPAGRPATSG